MAKTKNQQISHKGKGKYLVYKNSNRAELNKMARIFDNNGLYNLLAWTEKNNLSFLLKKLKKEKPSFAKKLQEKITIMTIKSEFPASAQVVF